MEPPHSLAADRYRLLALDYLGTGDSDKPKTGFTYTVQEQADLIAQMIQELDLGRANLIGASYGGAIVLNLPAHYPDRVNKVVSIEGGIVRPKELPASPLEFVFRYPVIGDLVVLLIKTGLLTGLVAKTVAGKWYPHMSAQDKHEMWEQQRDNSRSAARIPWYWISVSNRTCEDFEGAAKAMLVPILYLYGQESDFATMLVEPNVRFLETYLPQTRIVGLEGGIHDLEFQQPRQVADLVLEFLG